MTADKPVVDQVCEHLELCRAVFGRDPRDWTIAARLLDLLATDYAAAIARAEAAERDAARWRWLRENCGYSGTGPHNGAQVIVYYADAGDGRHGIAYTGPSQRVGIIALDTAIDAAIAAMQEGGA